jgi:hypothetical protein
MGPTTITLEDALEQVIGAAKDQLSPHTTDGGKLAGVELRTGVLGRTRPRAPALAVTVPAGTVEQAHALHETWTVPLEVWSFVSSEEEAGEIDAILLALRGRSLLLADRSLGGLSFVDDVRSRDYEALGQHSQGRRVIARARVDVHLSIVEPDPQT